MTCALLRSTRGAMHIKPYIAMQAKPSYIWNEYSLLSKGLRGGKSRRLRGVSLLRRMLQVKTQKTHCKWASKKEFKDMACYIRLKNGDERVESGEFAETQMQRPPEQISSQNPYISVDLSLLSKGLRGGKERSDREESLLRRMLQVKTQKTHCKLESKRESKGMALPYPTGRRG
ncbi:MAG: hypothetical protein CL932_04115 [Deltaproteobacteria bacterium]|nr:hypothetical protein [Deltaproteobacteria bacterium]